MKTEKNWRVAFLLALLVAIARPGHTYEAPSALSRAVERKVVVAENQTIFTLFCLLNAGGYEKENRREGMHPARLKVREELMRALRPELASRIRDYYRQHRSATPYDYSVVAMSTGGPPDFKFGPEWPEVSKEASFAGLADLPPLLRDLYASASIAEIYARVRPDYRSYNAQYRAAVVAQVAKVMAYCRVSELSNVSGGEVPSAVVIPNLLQSYSNAFSFVLGDTFYSIEGPQEKIGYNPHEFVHSVTNPMSYDPRYQALQAPAQPLFDLARKQPDMDDLKNLQNFLDENLVRAISLKYLDDGDPARSKRLRDAMMREYRAGYTLEPFFYQQLALYRKSTEPLATFYPTMLKHLNVKDELARWERQGAPQK
jgi:hypothetical protein